MKKTIVVLTLACGSLSAFAQKSKIRDAQDYLHDNNYKKAIPVIDEAVASEDTKNNADAWYYRGIAYMQKAMDTTAHAPEAVDESYNSLAKALSIKPDYNPMIDNALYADATLAFNEGVAGFRSKEYTKSYDNFMKVTAIYNAAGAKHFAASKDYAKAFPDLVNTAKTYAGYSALNSKRDAEALSLFNDLIASGAAKGDSNVYQYVIDINQRLNNDAGTAAAINQARSSFPNNQNFRKYEIAYYMRTGKQDVIIGKLEDAVKAEPNNSDLLSALANAYQTAAFPKDASDKELPQPSNYNELFTKSEENYKKAIAANPSNADLNYNLGVLYYTVAASINKKMNAITGTSPAEEKQYKELMAQRDNWFDKAIPPFEAAYNALDAQAASLTMDQKITYQKAMIGLREIYSRKNNKAKTDELKKKLDALH